MTTDIFRFADDLGPKKIVTIYDPRCDLRAVLVVDNVAAGPSIGGTRMAPDVSVEECFRLARAMTLKNAAAGLAHGGGKSVIFADPSMDRDDKERLDTIEGIVPSILAFPKGCKYWTRCSEKVDRCEQEEPELRMVRPGGRSSASRSRR